MLDLKVDKLFCKIHIINDYLVYKCVNNGTKHDCEFNYNCLKAYCLKIPQTRLISTTHCVQNTVSNTEFVKYKF